MIDSLTENATNQSICYYRLREVSVKTLLEHIYEVIINDERLFPQWVNDQVIMMLLHLSPYYTIRPDSSHLSLLQKLLSTLNSTLTSISTLLRSSCRRLH